MVWLFHACVVINFASTWKVSLSSFLSMRRLRTNLIIMGQALAFNSYQNFFSFVFQICIEARMWRVCVCCHLDSSRTEQRRDCGRISSETIYGENPQLLSSYSVRRGGGKRKLVALLEGDGRKRFPPISSERASRFSLFLPPPLPPPKHLPRRPYLWT